MSPATKLLSVLLLLVATLRAQSLGGQSLGGQTTVGHDAPVRPITLTLAAGTLDSIHVYTQGSEKYDFAAAPGGTCTVGQAYLAGQTCIVNLTFHALYPGERRGAIVLLPSSGQPLAQQFVSAQAVGSVNTFVPGTMTTVAGNAAWIYAGDGQPATQTSIFLPFSLALDAEGDLYLADSSNNRIRRVDASSGLVSTVAGTGNIGATGDDGPAIAASLANPSGVALDPAGNLYFADSGNNAIRRIDAFTGVITTIAGTLNRHGYTGDSGPATAATLNTPDGLALDAAGNLYFADTGNHVIRRVDAVTGLITTVAGTGSAGYNGDALPARHAQLNSPWSVTVAPTGELYVADQNNQRIRMVSAAGIISTVAGTGSADFTGDHGPATQAQLNEPASVALDVAGNLYIADSGNNRIRKISAKDATITTIAGIDGESFSGDGGPADQAGLYGPYTLALDGADNLFIADVFHNRIRKISANQATLKFPDIRVGRVSAPILQTVENDGNAPLNFTSIAAVSNTQVDASTVCSISAPLAPLDTCATGVDFAPKVTGSPVQGTLALNSDAGNGPGLILPWGNVLSIDPTTLVLSASANPGLTGQTITFSVQALSAGTTPTGTLTFTDVFNQSTTTLGTATLANGTATLPVTGLLTGAHAITAGYSGDDSNAASTTSGFIETIKDAQAPTVTSLSSSASPIDAGASLTLTATIATKSAGAGSFTLAGTVTFLDGTNTIGTAQLNAATATFDRATATFTTAALGVGSHSLTAAYVGTANDLASTSPAITQVVRLATTTLQLTASANPVASGAPLALTATATSTGGTPGGSIGFFAGATPVGSAMLNGQGVAVLQLTSAQWLPGTYALTATYAGDAADSPASSVPLAEVALLAKTDVLLASSINPAGQGAQVVFTATAASNGGTPTGLVTFYDGGLALGSATLDAGGSAHFSTSSLALGAHAITAAYAGDAYDANATSAPISEQIQAATTAVTLVSSKVPSLSGDAVTLSAAVTGSGATPSGSMTFYDGANALGTVALDATGHAAYTTTALTIGDHLLTATYSGDTNHGQVTSAPVDQQVLQATALTLQTGTTRTFAGVPVQLRAMLAGTSNQPGAPQPTGPVVIFDGVVTIATLTPDATGLATYPATLSVGQHSLSAAYAGDKNDAGSHAPSVGVQVDIATTTAALTATPSPAGFGAPVTLTATVSGNGGTPAGALTFLDGAATLTTVPLSANGTATLTLTTLAPGIHALTAVYAGDANDVGSQSPAVQEQVTLHTTLGLAASANPALLGDPVTLTLVAANGSATVPTGVVTVTDNGSAPGPVALVNGSTTLTLAAPALGTHTLLASYAGDASNGPASAQPLVLTVTLRPSTTSLTASASALAAGQQLILISVVQATGGHAPTGTVTFQAGSATLGVVPISAAGVATLTLLPPAGTLNVTAQYSGDGLYAASTAVAVPVVVGPPDAFTLTPTPATLTVLSGGHGAVTVGVASNPKFNDTLALGCAGLPQYATCTFSTDRMALTPGLPQSFTVTVDTGNPLGAGAAALLPLGALLALTLRRRRRLQGLVLAMVIGVIGLSVTGCATQFAQSTTPSAEYSFQIVGTGVGTGATETATIHLSVTK